MLGRFSAMILAVCRALNGGDARTHLTGIGANTAAVTAACFQPSLTQPEAEASHRTKTTPTVHVGMPYNI